MIYLLALIISSCLATAQALWGSAVKTLAPAGSDVGGLQLLVKMTSTPKFWIGALLYAISTGVYFLLLSKAKFFSVQLTMTGVAVLVSVAISYVFFHEHISAGNLVGVALVLAGIVLVTH